MSEVSWQQSRQGTAIQLLPDGTYTLVRESGTVMDTLRSAGLFTTLVQALEATGLAQELSAPTDPDFKGSAVPLTQGEDRGPLLPNFPW